MVIRDNSSEQNRVLKVKLILLSSFLKISHHLICVLCICERENLISDSEDLKEGVDPSQ